MYAVTKLSPAKSSEDLEDYIIKNGLFYKRSRVALVWDAEEAQRRADSLNRKAQEGVEYYVANVG